MASIEINLYELAVYVEDNDGDAYERSIEWAKKHGISGDYIDYVWEQFDTNDRQRFIGQCHDVSSMVVDLSTPEAGQENCWMIPDSYKTSDGDRQFTKFLVSRSTRSSNKFIHTNAGEILIPAPYGLKAKKRVRHDWHFLLGIDSVKPAHCGQVEEKDPMTSQQFMDLVTSSSCADAISGIGLRELDYFLD